MVTLSLAAQRKVTRRRAREPYQCSGTVDEGDSVRNLLCSHHVRDMQRRPCTEPRVRRRKPEGRRSPHAGNAYPADRASRISPTRATWLFRIRRNALWLLRPTRADWSSGYSFGYFKTRSSISIFVLLVSRIHPTRARLYKKQLFFSRASYALKVYFVTEILYALRLHLFRCYILAYRRQQ